ncbi:hypothetical protein [Enterovibrio norvegicus]|uniref:hypothetical protein n=1 Tax=Enterovibrio norvegicus TaxID=188144 RepID=UPI000C85D2D8|nr:hypothetical protein [Enterovibrio norvegicus]PMI31776.1 hypothetical protein BCU47_14460 [Enterovibrio norvegicus]TKF17531.1 hypothetical protein FCV66_04860 [Enterovibrio norvegicus]TKF35749.1 hypothetical protein FCV83_04930 [Enterovibrio norvegicus]
MSDVVMSLYIGPVAPVPVTKAVIHAFVSCEVRSVTTGKSGFQLVFEIDNNSPLHTVFLLSANNPIPMVRTVIAVEMFGKKSVLMDGVVTDHAVSPGAVPGVSRLTLTGEDLSRVLDYIDFSFMRYPAMPDFARINLVLAKYAFMGLIPKVIPSVLIDVPVPTQRIPAHQGTDLKYIMSLADRVGYVFYIEPTDQVGVSVAYWGPDVRLGKIQKPLNDDLDAHRNVVSLSGSVDTQSAVLPTITIMNPQTKVPITLPVPDVNPLNPPLGIVRPIPLQEAPITGTAKYSPVQAALVGLAKAAKSAVRAVKMTGTLDVLAYGSLLEARKNVSVRGAGHAFNGLHYVDSVTTTLSEGELKQTFELRRDGLLSTVSRVPL